RGGTIRPDTLIWYAGMPDWRPAGQMGEFGSLFAQAPRPPTVPAPRPPAGVAPAQRMGSMAGAHPGQFRQAHAGGYVEPRMGFGGAISTCFRKYVDFTDRARRKEYWFWHLFFYLALIGALLVDAAIAAMRGPAVFTLLVYLGLLLPSFAVA